MLKTEKCRHHWQNFGDFSSPIETPAGWHIIKLIEKKPIPEFSKVYEQINADLPFYTTAMIGMSVWIRANVFFLLTTIFIVILCIWIITLTDRGSLLKDRILLKVPIFGKIIEQGALSKFNKTFGILIGAGVSVLDAMKLISRVVDNRVYELAVLNSTKQIENGINISQALKNTEQFPPIMIQLLKTGEETGEIDNLALKASDFYTKQVNSIVDRLTSLIEPLLIILVGGVVGVVIIVTYLPIFNFGSALAQ